MSIQVEWESDSKRVIRYTFSEKWTWQDYHASIQEGAKMVEGISYNVNLIVDLTRASLLPENVISRVVSSMKSAPVDYDYAIIVSTSTFIEIIMRVVSKLSPKLAAKHPIVKSIEEARKILAEHDAKRFPSSTIQDAPAS